MYSTQVINNRIKSGFITLIHKKGPKTRISNYRTISLLNHDLKIFTTCLTTRLKPLITDLSHEHQYAEIKKKKFFLLQICSETCGGMHPTVKLTRILFHSISKKSSTWGSTQPIFILIGGGALAVTINQHSKVEELGKGRRRNVKSPSYADELTLTLIGSPSVYLAFEIIQRFSETTRLKLNIEKT